MSSQPGSDVPAPEPDDLTGTADALAEPTVDGPGGEGPHPGTDELVATADERAARAEQGLGPDGAGPPGGAGPDGAGPDGAGPGAAAADPLAEAVALAESRLAELQRERADFVNYRRRVERDRQVAGQEGREAVLLALLPVLDDVEGARQHGDLTGPFASVAEKLTATLQRLGLEAFGEPGEPFDPAQHEALLHDSQTEVTEPTCTQVLQKGYRTGERVLRPARVAVASPH